MLAILFLRQILAYVEFEMRKIRTVAGTGEPGYGGDGGPTLAATSGAPKAMRCDNRGGLIVVDTENNAVRRIDVKTGTVTTIAGGHREAPATAATPRTPVWNDRTAIASTTRAFYTSLTASIIA